MIKTQYKPNDHCNLLTLQQAVETFNLSEVTIDKIAKQCGAKLKIGRSARYRKDILQDHLNSFKAE